MKKVLFLMFLLLLMGLGAASVKAQVRIGGNAAPNAAAVLDLNATDGTNTGTKTLALPRVSLTSATDLMGNASLLTGMLVYNTTATPGVGVYYWDGSKWVNVGSFVEVDGVIGNEVLNATAGRGLTRAGSGTNADPYTLGIANGGVTAAMLAAGAAFDGDSIVGNEVTNATSGGGLVRAGSGTSASPYTLGIATGGVTASMLASGAANDADYIVGNEVTNATSGGGLVRAGSGTAASPFTLGITAGGITNNMIGNGAVQLNNIYTAPSDSGKLLMSVGTGWVMADRFWMGQMNLGTAPTTSTTAAVTWTKTYEGSFLAPNLNKNDLNVISVPGLNALDVCRVYSAGGVLLESHTAGVLFVIVLWPPTPPVNIALSCYRPSA